MKIPKFKNEAYTDWSKPANRKKQEQAIAKVEKDFGKTFPNIIGGERVTSEMQFNSLNPSNPSQVVGTFQRGTASDAIRALG
ncbi:MAG: L-glutamate gamma-semialdehyde dehydrogenase, partial [Bacteroidetes bacterium]